MRRRFHAVRFIAAFLALLVIACAGTAAAKKITPDTGTIDNATYANQFFDFSMRIPGGWYVVTSAEYEKAFEQGKKAFTIEKTAKSSGDEKDTTYRLLNVSRFKPGSTLDLNPSFMAVADPVDKLKKLKMGTPAEYLLGIKKSMAASFLPVTFPRDIYLKNIDGIKFQVLEARIRQGDINFSQVFYAAEMKEHILTLTFTYSGGKDDKELQKLLKSIKFKK